MHLLIRAGKLARTYYGVGGIFCGRHAGEYV